MPQFQRLDVRQDQFLLALELVRHQVGEHLEIHVEQCRQGAHVDHVLEQLALARIFVLFVADARQRQADGGDIVAHQAQVQRFGTVVDEVPAGFNFTDILRHALGIDRENDVNPAASPQVALFTDPHLVPGGQALDVGRKYVLGADRQTHPEQCLGKQVVGTGRAGAVYVGELDDEVVNRFQPLHAVVLLTL